MVQAIEQQAVNTIRVLAGDLTCGAKSGHPGKHAKSGFTLMPKLANKIRSAL